MCVLASLVGACSSGTSHTAHPGVTTTTPARNDPVRFAPSDPTFDRIPSPIPAGHHGDLIRFQPIEKAPPGLRWYRIMYRSTTVAGRPTVETGILTVPSGPVPKGGWKLATHAHGQTGLADDCAPSRSLVKQPVTAAELMVVGNDAAKHGYVVASTDYEGQGGPGRHPFLVGESEGRSVLDAARAARQFPGLRLPDSLGIIGYSQGGHAALWANRLAATWTPELHVIGTLAGAPASEVTGLLTDLPVPVLDNPQAVEITAGFTAADPTLQSALDTLLTAAGKELLRKLDASCTLPDGYRIVGPLLTADPTTIEPWRSLMLENTPGAAKTADPILIVHSAEDGNVPIAQSAALLARMCKAGQVVERRVLPTGAHVPSAVPAYAQGFEWLDGLIAGKRPVSSC